MPSLILVTLHVNTKLGKNKVEYVVAPCRETQDKAMFFLMQKSFLFIDTKCDYNTKNAFNKYDFNVFV